MQSWIPFIPEAASNVARQYDALFFFVLGVTSFFTVLISLTVIFFVIRYRRRSPYEVPRPIAGSHKLETIWTIIPFIIAMVIFVWSTALYFAQYRGPKEGMEIYVVGKQWMWKFQHTTGQREINELHVPVGTRVKLTMATEDVIHSLFIPAFRIKQDVVPGRYTALWFQATQPGEFELFCAEYCGTNHSGMIGKVIVLEPTKFNAWLSGNANQQTPLAMGQQLYEQQGCASCHALTGEGGRGPSLQGLVGSQVDLEDGRKLVADEEYIRESINNPQAKIVYGFKPIMPTFQGQLNEEQMLHLVTYIKSLGSPRGTPPALSAPAANTNTSAKPVASPKTAGGTPAVPVKK
jgi:cytochrome c oxidase subunit 2